jgi:hypothetical protein
MLFLRSLQRITPKTPPLLRRGGGNDGIMAKPETAGNPQILCANKPFERMQFRLAETVKGRFTDLKMMADIDERLSADFKPLSLQGWNAPLFIASETRVV